MRWLIALGLILVLAPLAACTDPTSATRHQIDHGSGVMTVARPRPTAPVSIPDSVGIPPSIPPIIEEAPAELGDVQ